MGHTAELLIQIAIFFAVFLALMAILTPLFIYRIRTEVIDINRKITEYLKKQQQ